MEKTKDYIGKDQFGFMKGRSTRDAIATLRVITEKLLEHGKDLFVCFVDFEKAFDRVNWIKLMEILKNVGVDYRDRRMIWELYMNQSAEVIIGEEISEAAEIGRGVRQGGLLSTILFNIYVEFMLMEALEDCEDGVNVGGERLAAVRYADDQAMIAITNVGLQCIMDRLVEVGNGYDMKVNGTKTKIMRISIKKNKKITVIIEGMKLKQVQSFCYLGSIITEEGRCEKEIRCRIGMAKGKFLENRILLTNSISTDTKISLIKALIWSVALYASEAWTMNKIDIKRIESFEMWCWRKMLKVKWTDMRRNVDILNQIGLKREMIVRIKAQQQKWIGHNLRSDTLLKTVLEGRFEGKTKQGRPRTRLLDSLRDGKSYGQL